MTTSRTVRLSAVTVLLVVAALTLGTRPAEAGIDGHVSGLPGCNIQNGNKIISWNFSSNGATITITGATMSGATTGPVSMTPTDLNSSNDEANGTAEFPNTVVGDVTLTVNWTIVGGGSGSSMGTVTVPSSTCGGGSSSSSSSSTSSTSASSTTTTSRSTTTTARVSAVAARPAFTG